MNSRVLFVLALIEQVVALTVFLIGLRALKQSNAGKRRPGKPAQRARVLPFIVQTNAPRDCPPTVLRWSGLTRQV